MPVLAPEHDAIGHAIYDYYSGVKYASVAVFSTVDDNYFLNCSELFRCYEEMTDIDCEALELCRGSVLDVGAGAGSHSLYLQSRSYDVTALEISPKACDVIQSRGVRQIVNQDFFDFRSEKKYDTLLLMMNGIGFVGSLEGLNQFLVRSKALLNVGGSIIFDSTFLSDDHKMWCEENDNEYGKVDYQMIYNEYATDTFYWLYVDFEVIKKIASNHGFEAILSYRNDREEYVAQLILTE